MFGSLFSQKKIQWGLLGCADGSRNIIGSLPLEIPHDSHADAGCTFTLEESQVRIEATNHSVPFFIDGRPSREWVVEAEEDHALIFGSYCFAIRGDKDIEKWLESIDSKNWFLKKIENPQALAMGPYPFSDLLEKAEGQASRFEVYPKGFSKTFPLKTIVDSLNFTSSTTEASMTPIDSSAFSVNSETGELTCPTCWLRFDRGDIMHIAVHENLRGDPILGPDVHQRFYATHFNDRMQAIDALGAPCTDIACPHCRRKLPFGFVDTPHIIFSIVGAPSSGKSYYLSVLIKVLQNSLHKNFGIYFKDSDPSGNAILNEMKNHLFDSVAPEQAALIKTQLEGVMYERLPRYGRTVALPKPFVFDLGKMEDPKHTLSIVFYDNAGEHFEPGINMQDSPGAQHMASSSGIFFLFDPTSNAEFRKRLVGSDDPQLSFNQRFDQQDIILSETSVRIKNLLGLSSTDRIDTPLALMVGKSDVWFGKMGPESLSPLVHDGAIDLAALDGNSSLLREMLLEICPSIVMNAEAISTQVRYFAVSALGHSPIRLSDGKLAPDPTRLNPIRIDEPSLWVLSKTYPRLVPTLS